jgi:endonuclease YncB( thermonuclease family)
VIDKNGRITVRLQGIDAPELHYRAGPLAKSRPEVTPAKRQEFNALNKIARRQYWAETATVALARKLANLDNAKVACEVYSLVDHPYELVDTYGRVVGNVRVGTDFRIDVNVWLVILSKGQFLLEPHEVVFKEKFSSVVDAKGRRIEKF